ncbi:hypothetical protein [Legionella cincinnatiensis]|uniref:Transmembrane protein n=1 Tax=Legionella cincinnatiensis TaxID=28085 RepID=A0A378ITP7_9GAMM|nr:hypothetical protein [Legionella cincinnatiensis]KTC89192.1 hypothetical protein Lcin_1230 [Legionella cincinnatiensis]STX35384.1 Uncharacterised protein [Legionella cincinnatiensis]
MNKIFGLISLVLINSSLLYLIYWYVYIASSIKVDNIFNIPYEPSGMQLFFYFISLPFFLVLALLSLLHSYHFELRRSLCTGIPIIWLAYFILILCIDFIVHFSARNNLLYYGILSISCVAVAYLIYSTYCQFLQLSNSTRKN